VRPPPISRSYRTVDRINADRHFNLDVYLDPILGYPNYVEVVRKAAASMSAYDVARGTRTPFPSAFHFIEEAFGMRRRDAANKFTRQERAASVWLLRAAFKLKQYIEANPAGYITAHVRCPKCGKRSIRTQIGKIDKLLDEHPRVVALHIECACKKFRTSDHYEIEALALSEAL
jgi:hypothetical protein